MKKRYIIKKNYQINKIMLVKNSYANKYFVIYKAINNIDHFRFVVSIGKKVGNAVVRNKVKRRIKAIIYNIIDKIENFDILIIVRPFANNLNFNDIEKQLLDLFTKAKLLKKSEVSTQ